MKKTHSPQQGNLIVPPVVLDLRQLFSELGLSDNEQGIVKRRLIETRGPFGKVLQRLVQLAETRTLDILQSLNLKKRKAEKSEVLIRLQKYSLRTFLNCLISSWKSIKSRRKRLEH